MKELQAVDKHAYVARHPDQSEHQDVARLWVPDAQPFPTVAIEDHPDLVSVRR